ncbi:MAG: redoxin domain-containing protein [Verrucomicrobia bacterium]|nr:redoxin domain-containing protein [Cytophagales bacterium]
MKNVLILILLLLPIKIYAQTKTKLTIRGNPQDSTVIKRKQDLEKKGFEVEISNKTALEMFLESGDQVFRKAHLNKPLPDFELKDMNGKIISSKDLKGKFVHINFWSVTCVPCIQEFP